MNNLITCLVIVFFGLANVAEARVLGVSRPDTAIPAKTYFLVEAEVCGNSFPTLEPTVSKLIPSGVLVRFMVNPGHCETPDIASRFLINLDKQIRDLDLDPTNAEIFFQMQ